MFLVPPCAAQTMPSGLEPGLLAVWPNLGRVLSDFSFRTHLKWYEVTGKPAPTYERFPFMEPTDRATGHTKLSYNRITGLAFFNDAFEPDTHKKVRAAVSRIALRPATLFC